MLEIVITSTPIVEPRMVAFGRSDDADDGLIIGDDPDGEESPEEKNSDEDDTDVEPPGGLDEEEVAQ